MEKLAEAVHKEDFVSNLRIIEAYLFDYSIEASKHKASHMVRHMVECRVVNN